jgi:Flp pilus assembly protein TadG
MTRLTSSRGTALLEVAFILPLVLLISVGIFEFGRAYENMQVLTNAAREGARIAVLSGQPAGAVETRVRNYLTAGGLTGADAGVSVVTTDISLGGAATTPGSKVTVTYPFSFLVLQPVARLVVTRSAMPASFTMTAVAEMRNEQ